MSGSDNFTDAGTQQDAYTLYRANRANQTRRPNWFAMPYATSWSDFGLGYQASQYCIDLFGFVHLRGLATCSTTITLGMVVATLPAGYCPAAEEVFTVEARFGGTNSAAFFFQANTNGQLLIEDFSGNAPSGTQQYISFSGITFAAAAA